MTNGRETVLRVEGLGCRVRDFEVFSSVSFALEAGQVAFLTGPNGAGKTTLLRCLAGRLAPTAGSFELCGRPFDPSDRRQRGRIAFVADTPAFYDDLTADEHVRFVRQANRVSTQDDDSDELLEAFGLSRFRGLYPAAYSRGMRQKLACVMALAARPALLLMDEPYGPLDPASAEVLSAQIARARDAGAAVLVSCHHAVPLLEPDKLLHLSDGTLAEEPGGGRDAS